MPASLDQEAVFNSGQGCAMQMSVVIPVHHAGEDLRQCLAALARSHRQADEVIVVVDGETGDTTTLASAFGCRIVTLPGGPRGPATARNRGVKASTGNIVVFLDSDVVAHRETLGLIEQRFINEPDCDALFGSYDDTPAARGLASRYKNLIHHFVHQQGRREATSFWSGCGAVRRHAFDAVGGFNERFAQPSIEDIELGMRLRDVGRRICLCPEIQVKHLKRWTYSGVWMTDIFKRALPWSRLLVKRGVSSGHLNVDRRSQLSAITAHALIFSAAVSLFTPWMWSAPLGALAVFVWLQRETIHFFYARGGFGFMIGATAMHLIYFLYSSAVYAYAKAEWLLSAKPRTQSCPQQEVRYPCPRRS